MAQTKLRKEQISGNLVLIEDINLTGGTQATLDFQNIPATYKSLRLDLNLRADGSVLTDSIDVRFNNDSGSNYDWVYEEFDNNLANSEGFGSTFGTLGFVPGATAVANSFSNGNIFIGNYASANIHKLATYAGGYLKNTSSGGIVVARGTMRWRSTSAISRITILTPASSTVWVQYSRATLYGIV